MKLSDSHCLIRIIKLSVMNSLLNVLDPDMYLEDPLHHEDQLVVCEIVIVDRDSTNIFVEASLVDSILSDFTSLSTQVENLLNDAGTLSFNLKT